MPTTTVSAKKTGRGFTLVEIMVATALSAIVLAGVLTSVLMITRSGYLLTNYIDMERQARNALETFAVDARITENVEWARASDTAPLTGITLVSPEGNRTTYTFSAANQNLVRT